MDDSTGTTTGPSGEDAPKSIAASNVGPDAVARRGGRRSATVTERGPGRIKRVTTFYRQVAAELRKVIWPTRKELITYTSVVLVFVLFMVTIVGILDFAFGQAVIRVFGA